jgi:hypothetical protein
MYCQVPWIAIRGIHIEQYANRVVPSVESENKLSDGDCVADLDLLAVSLQELEK